MASMLLRHRASLCGIQEHAAFDTSAHVVDVIQPYFMICIEAVQLSSEVLRCKSVRPAAVSGVAILMGLNLLGALPLRLPSLDMDVRQLSLPPLAQASAPREPGIVRALLALLPIDCSRVSCCRLSLQKASMTSWRPAGTTGHLAPSFFPRSARACLLRDVVHLLGPSAD